MMTYSKWDVAFLFAITSLVGIVGYTAGLSTAKSPAACPGECCPCDAVDAHVVAKWLDEHRDDVITNTGQGIQRSYSNRYETKGGLLVIFLSDDRGDAGQAPVGDAEGEQ